MLTITLSQSQTWHRRSCLDVIAKGNVTRVPRQIHGPSRIRRSYLPHYDIDVSSHLTHYKPDIPIKYCGLKLQEAVDVSYLTFSKITPRLNHILEATPSNSCLQAPQVPKHPHHMGRRRFRFRSHSAHTPSKHQDYLLSLHNTHMSQFLPHAQYAEDQRYPYAILAGHVLYRGFAAGALVGALVPFPKMMFRPLAHPLPVAVLRSTGMGTLVGTGVMALALAGRMYGREEIEWKDRSWRLLANKGQVEVDTWSGVGTVMGALLARGKGWQGRLGGAGLGNLVGVGGYLGWRYGLYGGKFGKGKWEEDAV